jgi:6-phosphofructokinase
MVLLQELKFSEEFGIKVIGVPGTIDNDILVQTLP